MTSDVLPLAGRRIALPESRELDLFADMLIKRGAEVLRCPLVSIHDAPDQAPVLAWLQQFVANPGDDLILLTGEGLRRLMGTAERAGGDLAERFTARLGEVRKITRGPKPGAALRKLGLKADVVAVEPTTEGVIKTLEQENLQGRQVAVQLYGTEPNELLIGYLTRAGARVTQVSPYVYADHIEDEQVDGLINAIIGREVDAIAFTSATQVRRLFQIARQGAREEKLLKALTAIKVAAVGPVVAEELNERGVGVDLMPESSYFMKPLVRELVKAFTGHEDVEA
ncbi:uroporphyrinogen-III synthase [Halopseudomonas nanhaiensis]|uniref:uroporphyrinogen-III synthase n=1 Tax=Halopseudomonas nanhaiensis TaxID=2830842 RepID=UPI001CC1B7F4|nr:uroporphyrinogen-III synthase [Halopseudomonas nanhaiensis]UAW99057.1 uroporphyrinogen-III synthase [Halopseudomonas nanhaiensis]